MHQQFLNDLMKAADVYLVSRLRDERLNYPANHDFRIFLPDFHLIGKERDKKYNFTTNHTELLEKVLETMINFKLDVEKDNRYVTVYHLGDFMDLWREIPSTFTPEGATDQLKDGVQRIIENHSRLYALLKGNDLNTHFLLGNHDFDLHLIPEFSGSELYYYFPSFSPDGPSAFALHGDVFSCFERTMPDNLAKLGVYIFGPGADVATEKLGEFRKESVKMHQGNDYSNYIQLRESLDLKKLIKFSGNLSQPDTVSTIPPGQFNIKRVGHPDSTDDELSYIEESRRFAAKVNEKHQWDMRLAVIGHTHRARIAVDETDGFFALMDCGSWIENCTGSGKKMRNAQIGVLFDNEARVYQLQPKST
ncbi:MAG: hypothetical protein GY940_25320 [bacterium]|nr:hypothetical protein [bacterium]